MVAMFVWPWKNEAELLEVRQLFYPDVNVDEPIKRDNQQLAVNIVNTWKLRRARIPHSILATADLVDAILHHDLSNNSLSTIKAVYASALAKMVTSVCDLEQDSAEKRSMMEQAIRIGMPEEWVQLRHAITHGQTPGLRALEDAVKDAIPWMWYHFWRDLDGEDAVTSEALRSDVIEQLTQYSRQRRAAITSKQEASIDANLAAQTSKSLKRAIKQRKDGLNLFLGILLEDSIILPSEKQSTLKFKALLLVWNDLLIWLAKRQHNFQRELVTALAIRLTASPSVPSGASAAIDIASKWLRYMLLDSQWAALLPKPRLEDLRLDVAEMCLLRKDEHSTEVLRELFVSMSGQQSDTLKHLLAASETEESSQSMHLDQETTEHMADDLHRKTGWSRPVAIWTQRAIGD